jgi:hypothetical protein
MARQTSGGKGNKNTPAAAQPKAAPKIVKDSKGNIDPRYGKKIQQEQGVLKPLKSSGRGNPITAAKTPEQIRNEARGKMFAGTVSKETKKKKKKIVKDETNTATLPIDLSIYPPGDPTGGYIPYTPSIPTSVKVPDRDALIALQRDGADQALITSVLFEQIGATELVKFVKNDTVDGLNPQYNVISNIADLKTKLDTSYLIAKQRPDVTIDNGFSIRLQDKLPSIDYLFDNNIPNYIHFDATMGQYGSLVIELDNIDVDEIVEVEIDTNGTIVEVR